MDTLCLLDCLTEHLAVKVIPYCIHMPMLFCSQKISGASEFQITHCNLESTSQICIFSNRRKSFFCSLFQHRIPAIHKECISSPIWTSDSSTKLIQLWKSISVRIMNDHRIDIGNIQSGLNDRCRNQYIYISVNKCIHDCFQLSLTHLSMGKIHSRIRQKLRDPCRHICNIIHAVINIINLTASSKLTVDCLSYRFLIILHNICLNRNTIHRRLFQDTHVADTDHTHMECSRNRCCR